MNVFKNYVPPDIAKIFLAIFLFFGLLFVFITPPIYTVDESTHFYRAYQVSTFHFIPHNVGAESGGPIPSGITAFVANSLLGPMQKYSYLSTMRKDWHLSVHSQPQNVIFTNVSIYPP